MSRIQEGFAALGPQGQALSWQLVEAVRTSLASAITSIFVVGTVALILALVVTFFLQEIPLRKSHSLDAPKDIKGRE